MSHYDDELGGPRPERPKQKPKARTTTTTTGKPTTTGGVVRRRTPSAGGNVSERYEAAIAAYGSGATWDETITYWGTALYSAGYDLIGIYDAGALLQAFDEDGIAFDEYGKPDIKGAMQTAAMRNLHIGMEEGDFAYDIVEQIRADVDERGTGVQANRVADVRRGVVTAIKKQIAYRIITTQHGGKTFTPRARKPAPPPQHALHVRNLIGPLDMIENLHSPGANPEALLELSPCLDFVDQPPCVQTELFMRALYRPSEYVHVLNISDPPAGIKGVNIRTAAEWLDVLRREGELPGDGVLPNPLTGELGTTSDGKASFIANNCIAEYPYALIEFDDIKYAFGGDVEKGLAAQYAFWVGFINQSKLAPALVSVTQSGGKSLHGLLHVGAKTLQKWQAIRARLMALFASDTMRLTVEKRGKQVDVYPFRVDPQSLRPRQATRLAGAFRRDKGTFQGLVYLNPDARPPLPPPPPTPIDPNGKPPCGAAFGMRTAGGSMCGVCVRLPDCPFADPDAVPGTTLKGNLSASVRI